MASGGGKPPPAPDPAMILALQNQYNRTNSVNPFGSSMWSTDANGHETNTISANPRTQGAIDRAFTAAETPYQQEYVPQGMDQLASAIMGRVGARYGLGTANPNNPSIYAPQGAQQHMGQPGALNTNMKPQQSSPPPPQIQGAQGGPGMRPGGM